jgi:hypothetical protein
MRHLLRPISLLLLPLMLSCTSRVWQAHFVPPTGKAVVLDQQAPFLKCHTPAGDVYVLTQWQVDEAQRRVSGTGLHYDAMRRRKGHGTFSLSLDEVALFETNRPQTLVNANVVVLAVLTGVSLAATALCLINPKACFGSCPTFYAHDGQGQALQAEGFSEAIAPVFERTDVDALYTARPNGPGFELRMTNEALETHAVRSVRLLAAPRPPGGRVFHTRGKFLAVQALEAPRSCQAATGDCLSAVSAVDESEYHSPADEKDLSTQETVELVFPARSGKLGLVVGGRNSLLNTFLLYQMMAYAGSTIGDWLMYVQRAGSQAHEMLTGITKLLGHVEAEVLTRQGWRPAGAFIELGPIAREVQLIPLPENLPEGEVRIRLRLTKGNWRLDYLALAELAGEVRPEALEPTRVERAGKEDAVALARLMNPAEHLATYPGDDYTLRFELPPGEHELFVESRGYYYEWMREEWLPEEDEEKLREALFAPERMMRRLAPAFKKLEPDMERIFWQSRYGRTP